MKTTVEIETIAPKPTLVSAFRMEPNKLYKDSRSGDICVKTNMMFTGLSVLINLSSGMTVEKTSSRSSVERFKLLEEDEEVTITITNETEVPF